MPTTLANPANVATKFAEARPGDRIFAVPGQYGVLTPPPLVEFVGQSQADVVLAGLVIRDQCKASVLTIDGGFTRTGIQAIDGCNGAALSQMTVRNTTAVAVFQQDNGAKKPNSDIIISHFRAQNASGMGILFSKTFGVKASDVWLDRIVMGGADAYHGLYWDEDGCSDGELTDFWVTRSATGCRGMPPRALRPLCADCTGAAYAASNNCARLIRPIAYNCPGSALRIHSQNPLYISEPLFVGKDQTGWQGIDIEPTLYGSTKVPCPFLQIWGGLIHGYPSDEAKGFSFNIRMTPVDSHGHGGCDIGGLTIASSPVGNPQTGRKNFAGDWPNPAYRTHGLVETTTTVYANQPKTLEDFAASKGLPPDLDALFNAVNWTQREAHNWLAEQVGMAPL